jgi:uncharacterized protein (TIGR03083 family)
MVDNTPVTTAELLRRVREGRRRFEALIDSLTEEQITRPGPGGGWSVKDHLAHLAMWEVGIAALLRRQSRWEAMGLSREIVKQNNEDQVNAIIERQHAQRPLAEVKDLFHSSHRALVAALEPLRDEELLQPESAFDPDSDGAATILALVVGNTFGHYDEHAGWIRELFDSAGDAA